MIKLRNLPYICIAGTSLLQGCLPVSANRAPSAAAQALLVKLRTCLDEVNARKPGSFTSSCANMKVTALRGISLQNMKAGLGPPGICDAGEMHDCRWAFYQLPDGVLGGGPELRCFIENRTTCKQVRWVETE